jgi:predicted RNA-binding protein YlxR (DUF448 family)
MERGATNRLVGVPLRTCAGCRRRRPQAELIRVARSGAGELVLDPPARGVGSSGRAAYVCPAERCIEQALAGGLKKMLKYEGSLPGDLRKRLLERIPAPEGLR